MSPGSRGDLVNRALWPLSFRKDAVPGWVCVACRVGVLRGEGEPTKVQSRETRESNERHHQPTPYQSDRFVWSLRCSNPECRETHVVCGGWTDEQDYNDEGSFWVTLLTPEAVYPALPMIEVPSGAPDNVKKELGKAFALYWADQGACGSRVRTTIEKVLTDRGIPTKRPNKKDPTKDVHLTLDSRIHEFVKANPQHGTLNDLLHAVRMLGNDGTHADLDAKEVLDALAVTEHLLDKIYGTKEAEMQKLAAEVKARPRKS